MLVCALYGDPGLSQGKMLCVCCYFFFKTVKSIYKTDEMWMLMSWFSIKLCKGINVVIIIMLNVVIAS